MSPSVTSVGPLYLRLPATSANLGPGFDTLAIALNRYLEITAKQAAAFSIRATGRAPEVCGAIERNLLLDVYQKTLTAQQREVKPLALEVNNGIPLGMGCGSSAAVRLAGVALAAHFGGLDWSRERILAEATKFEGHPDNAAACWLGGFVAGCWDGVTVRAVSLAPPSRVEGADRASREAAGNDGIARGAAGELSAGGCGGQPAAGGRANRSLCLRAGRSGCGSHARPDAPAVSKQGLSAAAATVAALWIPGDSRRLPERSGARGACAGRIAGRG